MIEDDHEPTWIWISKAAEMARHEPHLYRLVREAIANKTLRWAGHPKWKRPAHINYEDPKAWLSSTWNFPENVVRLKLNPEHSKIVAVATLLIRFHRDDFRRLVGLDPTEAAQASGVVPKEPSTNVAWIFWRIDTAKRDGYFVLGHPLPRTKRALSVELARLLRIAAARPGSPLSQMRARSIANLFRDVDWQPDQYGQPSATAASP